MLRLLNRLTKAPTQVDNLQRFLKSNRGNCQTDKEIEESLRETTFSEEVYNQIIQQTYLLEN